MVPICKEAVLCAIEDAWDADIKVGNTNVPVYELIGGLHLEWFIDNVDLLNEPTDYDELEKYAAELQTL